MNRKQICGFLLLILGVLGFRWLGLLSKPLHHDESINGWFVMQMWQQGFFRYDPTNYHGPLLFYIFQLGDVLFGDSLATYRGLTAFFSSLTVGGFLFLGFRAGWSWFLAAAVLLASPAAQFFGQSAIHESLFVFALLLMLLSLARLFAEPQRMTWIWLFALGLGSAFALKETISLFAVSVIIAGLWHRPFSFDLFWLRKRWPVFGWMLLGLFLIYTGFLLNFHGALDFFAAYLPWLKTGVGGGGHDKSFWYWLQLMFENEKASLAIALVGLVGFWKASKASRFFVSLAWIHLIIYSVIPYKTPWCLISIQLPLIFSGAFFLQETVRNKKHFAGVGLVLGGLMSVDFQQILHLSWKAPINLDHKYVYVQTQYPFKKVIDFLDRNQDELNSKQILVATAESWPLPWALRKFPLLSWGNPQTQFSTEVPVLILDVETWERIKAQFQTTHVSQEFETRQSRGPAVLVLSNEIFQKIGLP